MKVVSAAVTQQSLLHLRGCIQRILYLLHRGKPSVLLITSHYVLFYKPRPFIICPPYRSLLCVAWLGVRRGYAGACLSLVVNLEMQVTYGTYVPETDIRLNRPVTVVVAVAEQRVDVLVEFALDAVTDMEASGRGGAHVLAESGGFGHQDVGRVLGAQRFSDSGEGRLQVLLRSLRGADGPGASAALAGGASSGSGAAARRTTGGSFSATLHGAKLRLLLQQVGSVAVEIFQAFLLLSGSAADHKVLGAYEELLHGSHGGAQFVALELADTVDVLGDIGVHGRIGEWLFAGQVPAPRLARAQSHVGAVLVLLRGHQRDGGGGALVADEVGCRRHVCRFAWSNCVCPGEPLFCCFRGFLFFCFRRNAWVFSLAGPFFGLLSLVLSS